VRETLVFEKERPPLFRQHVAELEAHVGSGRLAFDCVEDRDPEVAGIHAELHVLPERLAEVAHVGAHEVESVPLQRGPDGAGQELVSITAPEPDHQEDVPLRIRQIRQCRARAH